MSIENLPEDAARKHILDLVEQFHNQFHQQKPFIPGESQINYAGRVYDHSEMRNLVDSSLDFWLTSGRYCDSFESKFAQYLGVKYSLLVNSGSSANLVAFSALTSPLLGERKVEKGDEVITAAAGFPTTVNPIIQFGALPVFVDVDIDDGTYNVNIDSLEQALTTKTKAVFLAHTLGNPFKVKEIKEFCSKNNLWLIEDNCDALGSKYNNQYTGTFGDIATSSFYPPHHLTMGEGGAVYTNSSQLKRISESFRDWGRDCWCPSGKDNSCKKRFSWHLGDLPKGYDHKYVYRHFGYNLKVTEMQAAIGVAQLDKLESFTRLRRKNFQTLKTGLAQLEEDVILPNETKNSEPSWFGFPVTIKNNSKFNRADVINSLESDGIQTRMLFAGNLLLHPMFDEMKKNNSGYRISGSLENTNKIVSDTFWVGVFPGMTDEKNAYMINSFKKAFGA